MMRIKRNRRRELRRGAAAVEFAFVAPLFVVILFGMAQAARLLDLQSHLSSAAREGGRVGSTDRSALPDSGQSTNDLVVQEIQIYLKSRGIDVDADDIKIVDPDDSSVTIDLDNPDNSLDLFEIQVQMSYDEISNNMSFPGLDDFSIKGQGVFRNAEVAP